jgi:negative regulator of flagellin synthesis FlgM
MDPIGSKPVSKLGLAPVAPTPPVARASDVATPQTTQAASSSMVATARELAAKPPVDADRVAKIKQAIEDGKFPLVPSTIADRLIAFKLNWKPDEPA